MACERCGAAAPNPDDAGVATTSEDLGLRLIRVRPELAWCGSCERAFDHWSRRHASDIIYAAVAGTVVTVTIAMVMPLLGVPFLISLAGVFLGFGALLGVARWNHRRRRRQFLSGSPLPRAILHDPSSDRPR